MADWLESFVPMRVHVLIRFGRWQELIDAPLPADPDLYLVTTAMLHYGKGVALAATGQITTARQQRALFATAAARVPESRTEEAFAHLRRAIELDDGLPYDEPWGWMQPARHAYGALLLEQDRVHEAEAVYRADLGLDSTLPRPCQHPGNVWSLHGYHECLTRLGKNEQAAIIGQQLRVAAARADVHIGASRYCRLIATPGEAGSGF
jgi:hypothetical protein